MKKVYYGRFGKIKIMKMIDIFKKYVPNPLSRETNYSDLIKKSTAVVETFRFINIIRNIIFILVLGFGLIVFVKALTFEILVLMGFGIIYSILIGFIKYLKIKKLSSIKDKTDGRQLKKILIVNEYHALFVSLVGFVVCAFSLSLIYIHFDIELWEYVIKYFGYDLWWIFIFLFVVFRCTNLILKLWRIQIIKKIDDNKNIAQISQSLSLINKKLNLINFVPIILIILLVLFLIGIPLYIVLIFFGFTVIMTVLSIIEIKRVGKIDFSTESPVEKEKFITLKPGEKIVGSVFGIMNLKRTGFAVLGVGKTEKAENSLLITDDRLIFVQFPTPGDNKIVDNMAYSDINFFWNRDEIKKSGQNKIENMSLGEIVKQYSTSGISFDEIAKLTLRKMEFSIVTKTNEEYKYLFMDTEYIEPLKEWLQTYLGERFSG